MHLEELHAFHESDLDLETKTNDFRRMRSFCRNWNHAPYGFRRAGFRGPAISSVYLARVSRHGG